MREIIHIHVGQAGNKIGSKFFEVLCQEHNLSPDGMVDPRSGSPGETNGGPARWPTEHLDVFFSEASGHRYVPRAVLVDLEPTTLNTVKGSPMGRLFRPDSMVLGARGASNNWAKGFYGEGRDHLDEVMDLLRKEVEDCDCPQGFQICHSIGGGTGAGMGSLLLGELKEAYPDRLLVTYPVFPSPKISEVVVEPYNAMLAINQLLEQSSAVMVLDNEALYDICYNTLKTPNPQFADLNALISAGMAGITASLRFPGLQNMDLRKMTLNLVPFPRMHFFQVSLAPLLSAAVSAYRKRNGWELTEQLFRSNNTMAACDPRDGRYMSACAIFRGHISALEVAESLMRVQANNSAYFVDWVPPSSHMQYCMCHIPPKNPRSPVAAALIGNNTAIRGVFKRVADQHYTMWFRKAFIHWYTDEGMEESEMEEAFNNVNDLMHEYEEHEVFVPGLEEEEELDMKALSGSSALPLPSADLEAANHVASSARDARAPARGKGKKGKASGGKKKRTKARPSQA